MDRTNSKNMTDRELLESMHSQLSILNTRFDNLDKRVGQTVTGLYAVQDRVHLAELRDNVVEQRDRNYACRFINFWIPEDLLNGPKAQRAACFWLYKKFIVPAFEEAQKVHGDMVKRVPDFLDIWDAGHEVPVKNHPDNEALPFIFKFTSRGYLDMFLEFATSLVVKHNDESGDSITIRKDLTAVNRTCMSRLHTFTVDGNVQDYWITGTTIKFTYKKRAGEDPNKKSKVFQVNNPFALTPSEMAKFPPKKQVVNDLDELASGADWDTDKRKKPNPPTPQRRRRRRQGRRWRPPWRSQRRSTT